jgi:hypothetical protein
LCEFGLTNNALEDIMTFTHQDEIRATAWRQSLRQHCDVTALNHSINASPQRLLKSCWGRMLIVEKLRELRPGLRYATWTAPNVIDPLLEAMVDHLGLRMIPEPRSLGDRFRFQRWVVSRMTSRDPSWARGFCVSVQGDHS